MLHDSASFSSSLSRQKTVTAICEAISGWIEKGELTHNDRLPAERVLSEQFATTRITLREALGQLEAQGIIYREVRRGWFVSPPRIIYNPLQRSHFHAMAREQGRKPATEILNAGIVAASETIAAHLTVTPETPVYCIRRLRHFDGRPVLYVEHYLNPLYFPAILEEDLTASLTELYATKYGIHYGKVRFAMLPTTFPQTASRALKVADNSPALFITRINRDQYGRIIDCDLEYWRYDTLHIMVEAE